MSRIVILSLLSMILTVAHAQSPTAEADAHLAAGEWAKARGAYAAVVDADAKNGAGWYGVGLSSLRLGEHAEALAAFERAIALEHQTGFALFNSARAHAALGDADAAIEALFAMAETGAVAAQIARSTPELAALSEHPRYDAALHALRACRSPEHRQFDFWLGDWDVFSRQAPQRPPSRNRISSREGGCVIVEEYETPGGYTGISLNFYDPNRRQWHQTWIDNGGAPILHSGGIVDGSMVLIDDPEGDNRNRTTWTPNADGTVRQHWERSTDGGESWTTVFDGLYRRRSGS